MDDLTRDPDESGEFARALRPSLWRWLAGRSVDLLLPFVAAVSLAVLGFMSWWARLELAKALGWWP